MCDHRALLLLAEQVAGVDADLGSETSQAWFTAAIDSLAHALVDLSDGRAQATTASAAPTPTYPGEKPEYDRASCAAARAELTSVRRALSEALAGEERREQHLGEHIDNCLDLLISALGEIAAHDPHEANGRTATAHRSLRAAFRVVQPPAALSSA
ncbi:MAG: hypothetical protein WBG57_11265 [Ornithinimicrobium sp.]